jgi:exoribonuclease R
LNASIQKFQKDTAKAIGKGDHEDFINSVKVKFPCIEDRTNIKDWYIFTIDPPKSQDFDDGFSIRCAEDGTQQLSIYIANVTIWLDVLNLWDSFSQRISTIYLPDKKRPMLPALLSDNLCSLKQGEDRFAFVMSVKYDMTTIKQIGEPIFKNSLINIQKNYDYEDKKLEKNPAYKVLMTLAKTDDSHDVVAFWMIKMNVAAAEHLRNQGKGIFRTGKTNRSPPPSNLLSQWLGNYGAKAIYSEVCAPHSQLGVDAYVHITSPIRRLVDILNQILFQSNVSELCQAFLDKWIKKLDLVNHATKEIRKAQMDCELLVLAEKNELSEFSGILFDQNLVKGQYEYAVYIEKLKLFSRIKLDECIENFTKSQFRIFVFDDEDRLSKKIQLKLN